MKLKLFLFSALIGSLSTTAQIDTNLIAHWNMNGSPADVTGRGHDGRLNNVVPVVGRNGVANSAYYFNGVNSSITAPSRPDLNFTRFSLCATLKVKGYYTGPCHANTVVARGMVGTLTDAHYAIYFTDLAVTTCDILDTTGNVFSTGAGNNTSSSMEDWNYSPKIVRDKWYSVVATYDSTFWRIYVNDTLMSTVEGQSNPMGTSTDSISMGVNIYGGVRDPYRFTGIIDDVKFYKTVLHDSDIKKYTISTDTLHTTYSQSLEAIASDNISVFPNPANNEITIVFPDNISKGKIEIFDQLGRSVKVLPVTETTQILDIQSFSTGNYFMKMTIDENTIVYKRFVKM
jgi:hypothetical protein